jgi:hypothetical protein
MGLELYAGPDRILCGSSHLLHLIQDVCLTMPGILLAS